MLQVGTEQKKGKVVKRKVLFQRHFTSFPVVKVLCNLNRSIMKSLKGQICPAIYTHTIAMMLSHLIRVQGSDPYFSLKCNVPGCQHPFGKPGSY